MSITKSGLESKLKDGELSIYVRESHPLVRLGNLLPWSELYELILPDLQQSTGLGKWWLGRKLKVRIHLGIYCLQQLFNKTDRQMEYDVNDNAAYQVFCGRGIVAKFHVPDHTSICDFRSRLAPQTQQKLANRLCVVAARLGFANPRQLDVDSTVQRANMSYPSDVSLMVKLGSLAAKVEQYLHKQVSCFLGEALSINLQPLKALAVRCSFSSPTSRTQVFELWRHTYEAMVTIKNKLAVLLPHERTQMPWNMARSVQQIMASGTAYLMDVLHYLRCGKLFKSKILSLHAREVACFNKGNQHQLIFGRQVQLGRVAGNFLMVLPDDVRLDDKRSLPGIIAHHQQLFGPRTLESVTADKGYYSWANAQYLQAQHIRQIGLQQPGPQGALPKLTDPLLKRQLINRRAGIEPLIGHLKNSWQLRRSRMKTDRTTHAAVYASVFAFNLRQLMRASMNKIPLVTAA